MLSLILDIKLMLIVGFFSNLPYSGTPLHGLFMNASMDVDAGGVDTMPWILQYYDIRYFQVCGKLSKLLLLIILSMI